MTDGELYQYLKDSTAPEARLRYRIRDGYSVRDFCGETLVIPVSGEAIAGQQMAILSPGGRLLWDRLQSAQTFADLLLALLSEYEVERETAAADIHEFLSELDSHKYLMVEKEPER